MNFWQEDKPITGSPEDAFIASFDKQHIPNGTQAIARVESALNTESFGKKLSKRSWVLQNGEFSDKIINQNIPVFDADNDKRHRAKSMLRLLFTLFNVKTLTDAPPTDQDLCQMVNKVAGLKIGEFYNDKGYANNFILEVHPVAGFEIKTGTFKKPPESSAPKNAIDYKLLDDGIPF